MSEVLVVIGVVVVAICSVETIDAFAAGSGVRAFLAPATVVRKHLAAPMPDASLGSPRWVVAAALLLPALALAALSLLPWTVASRAGDSGIGVFLLIMLLDFVAVIVATIGWSANRVLGVAALFGAILQLVAYGIVIGFGTIGPAMAAQSLSPLRIAQSQAGILPYAIMQPVSLVLYIVGGLAQTFRSPFTKPLEGAFDALGGLPSLAFRWGLDLAAFAMAALGVLLFTGAGGGAWWTVLLIVKTLLFLLILAPLLARCHAAGARERHARRCAHSGRYQMSASILFFIGASALTLGAAYFMLRTMSMLKAGVALMGCALGAAFLLFTLHADVVATMTIMMFGPAMLGMILFMLMLMEDSGGFMMTASNDVSSPPATDSRQAMHGSQAMSLPQSMADGVHGQMQMTRHPEGAGHGETRDLAVDDVEPEVEREAAGILGKIGEIAPMTCSMDMEMTNSQMRWAGWLASAFFVANAIVVVVTPWTQHVGSPAPLQPFLIGTSLLEKYMIVFEGCGFLILLSVIVATMVGRKAQT
jgi:NADH-quinone oxidoreductase subunit J